MNKSRYGKLSIIVILIATLFISAAIAIFGLAKTDATGANSSAEITAPEKDASSAIVNGEVADDGTISAPEIEAKAATTYTGLTTANWNSTIASSGNTLDVVANTSISTTVFKVPSGITAYLRVASGYTVTFTSTGHFEVEGTLYVYGGGTITANSAGGKNHAFHVNGGTMNLGYNGSGVTISNFKAPTGTSASTIGSKKGGAIYVYGGGTFNMSLGTISGNTAAENGGGVAVDNGTFNMTGGYIRSNTATYTPSSSGSGTLVPSVGVLGGTSCGGGGVYIGDAGTLKMSAGTIGGSSSYANQATNSAGGGGVYVAAGGTFEFSGGTISYNTTANAGGGVYAGSSSGSGVTLRSTFKMTGGTISYNSGVTGSSSDYRTGVDGGGVYNSGNMTMSAGTISYNTVQAYGGGVYSGSYGTFTMNGTAQIINNTAGGGGGVSGGVEMSGSATISGNKSTGTSSSSDGGYIQLIGSGSNGGGVNGSVNMSGAAKIINNTSNGDGGGVHGNITMSSGTISGNNARNGGGVYVSGTNVATITGGVITNNTATAAGGGVYGGNGSSQNGWGGSYFTYSTVNISGAAKISGNTAGGSGGGVFGYSKFYLDGGEISGNTAAASGGGVCLSTKHSSAGVETSTSITGILTMTAGTISNNKANGTDTYSGGGGVHADGTFLYQSEIQITMSGGTVKGNTARNGGGMLLCNGSTLEMTGGEISGNTATTSGGGIYSYGNSSSYAASVTLSDKALITRNTASAAGGGVYSGVYSTLTMDGGEITRNTTTIGPGGGIYASGYDSAASTENNTTVTINDGLISRNEATGNGGGVFFDRCLAEITGGEISGNVAKGSGGGGGLSVYAGTATMTGGTIQNNTATAGGGGVYVNTLGTFTLTDGTICGNTASEGGGVYVNGTLETTGGTITENTAGAGAGVMLNDGTVKLGDTAYIYGNTQNGCQNNLLTLVEGGITFSSVLTTGAKIGVIAKTMVLTNGFTAIGHVEDDIKTYFTKDTAANVLSYVDEEIVVTYDVVAGWNNTVSESLKNGTTETFILFEDWTAVNGSFGTGVGFCENGTILVPSGSKVILNIFRFNIDGAGESNSVIRVEGKLEIAGSTGIITGGTASAGGGVYIFSGSLTLSSGTISGNTASYGGGVYVDNGSEFTMAGGTIALNTVTDNGAGVYVNTGSFTMSGGVIGGSEENANTATLLGGGVYLNVNASFEMSGGTISYNAAQRGAGVYVRNGSFALSDSGAVSLNNATLGGGVYVDGGSLTMTGGAISENEADTGAGVYILSGSAAVSGGEISLNKADNGAGVYVAGGKLTVSGDGLISKNEATENGGGVYVAEDNTLEVKGGEISENTAQIGLGVYVDGGTVAISGGKITKHTAAAGNNGAGVYVASGSIEMNGGEISESKADNGAGVYILSGSLGIAGGKISENTAISGAGVYVAGGTLAIGGGEISENTTTENGAGVYVAEGTLTVSNDAVISKNEATVNGGGVYVAENGSVEIKGGAISENKSNTDELGNGGGGVYVSGGTVNMTGGKISGNTAVRAGGGLNVGSGTFTMNGGEISGNKANYGAGVYILSGSAAVKSGKISGNEATTSGGVYVAGGKLAINGGEISGNTAVYGGGLYVTENGTVEMTGGSVSGNTAENGGGVRNNGTFKMSGGAISDNTATVNGGGLHVYTDGEVEINGGEISGNTATANGGGVYVDGGALEMKEGTVTNNAAVLGAGVYVDSGAVTVTGTARIIYNDATENGGGIYVNGANAATLNDIGGYVSNNTAVVGGGIYVGGGNAATVTVGGYAVVGENTAATYGGGLAVLGGASVEITDDSSITYNKAENGGGAYVSDDGSVLALTNEGAFTYNKAILGGAVYVTTSSSFNMGSGTLSVNEAENGGAVYVNNATFTLSDGEISANIASENGGGVYVSSGTSTFVMNGGLIGGDEADLANSAVLGGGVYIGGGKATLSGGKITGNTATSNGGGVYFFAGTLEASGNPEISENTMNGIASNLYLYNGKMINIVGGLTKGANIGVTSKDRITDGYQTNGNGAAQKDYFFGDIPFTEVVFDNGEIYLIINNKDAWNAAVEESLAKGGAPVQFLLADRWTAEDGSFGSGTGFTDSGAIKLPVGAHINLNLNGYMINRGLDTIVTDGSVFYVEGTLVISGISGQITGGASEQGGGIYVADGGLLTLSVGLIQDNKADLGGGVYVESGATFEMTGGALRSNEATVNGGGVYVAEGGKFTLTGGTIGGAGYTNTAAEQGGGVYTCGDFTMSGGAISNNVANVTAASDVYGGGGVNVAKGTFNFENGTISNNTAANGYGGGVNNNGTFEMTGGTISNNTALNGAGIAGNGTLDMLGGEISGNTATEYGGGVYVVDGKVNLNDGTITGNSAENGGGVGACGGRIEINGVKINGNNATNGAGVYAYSDIHSLKFTGGEISGNTATQYGGGIYTCVELTMTDGKISGNNAITGAGMYITLLNSTATLTMNGGEISNNTANNYGGGAHISVGTLKMTGGLISGNSAEVGGGVCNYSTESLFVMEGGAISNNAATSTGGGVDVTSGTFTLTNGTISDNTATTKGGGVYAFGAFEMKNGTITGNSAANGGGVNVEYGTFTMVKGTVSNNTATNGGGVYADGTFEFKSGEISSNTSSSNGGGVFVNSGTFTMSTGTISNSVAANGGGVYVEDGATFNLNGGKIIANSASTLGGGVYVVATAIMNMSGSPMVYGNTAAGVESNVYLTANQLIIITGLLSVNGVVAYVGITMYDPKLFTQNFRATNTDYTPDLRPETVFFSDDSEYMVSADDAGEAVLKEKDNSQTAVVWQLSKDGGNTWAIIDAPYYSIRYNANDNGYAVRAIDVDGEEVEFTWTTDENGTSINANSFGSEGIGSYKFVINSDKYTNAALTVEILPAILLWQYSTDGDATWRDLTVDSFVYTGATYFIRACIQDVNAATGYSVVETFLKTMKDVDDYVFSIDSELYENTTLNFSITKRYVTVEWNFGDALGNADDGYYWNYDGLAHTPVAVLDGISGDLAGVDLVYGYAWSAGKDFSEAQAYAGTYTLNVSLNDSNVELSNTSVKYEIVGILLSLVWTDKDGNEGDEFTYEYNSEEQGVKFIVSGLVAGDEVKPYVTYATRAGKIIDGEPVAAGYYTATVKLPADCYSYVFDKTYTCQIAITKKSVKVEWGTNKDGTYVWTFNGQSKSPEVIIIDPFTGEQTVEPYKLEYATVAANGDIGTYTPNVPITAGDYIVRVTMKNVGSNIALDESTTTQKFTIAKRGVNITWTGGKGFYYDEDNRVYYWYYDGEEHSIVAEISVAGYAVYDGDKIIDNLDIVRLDVDKKLLDAESATAKVALADSAFNENFYILGNASQVYEVRKAIISSVVWTDPLLNKYYEGDTPSYDFGTVSGENGPNLTALANGTLELIVSYSKTYTGDWAVDETVGYIAYAKLSDKDAANYEFAEGAEYATLKFFITAVGGYKQDIDVTWVVFVNDNEYVTLEDYLKDGGFVYNGKVQYPTPVYIKDSGEVVKLELNMNSVGADAGDYTARLKPSSVYNISDEDFTCDYVINQLKINVKWQNSQYDSDTACEYVYNGKAQAPYAYVDGTYDFDVIITVNGEVNAGNHTATAVVGDNFKIVKGATKDYVIKKLGIGAGLVVWDFANAGASGDADNGWYWVFDGKEHGPTAMIPKANLGDDFDFDLVLVVTGNTSEIGTHTAYAVLNSSIALHNNFYLTDASSAQFEIVQVKVGQVYWTDGEHVYEDGAAGETGLEFTFNGEEKADKLKAYYYDAEGNKVDLTVAAIGGTAVNAGTYSARVTSELDFATTPSCTFKIKAMELDAEWKNTTVTFNNEEQKPTITLSDGVGGYKLEEGEDKDYVITGFIMAGTYTVQIKFLNKNYTVAEENLTCKFVIEKITLSEGDDFEWAKDGYDQDKGVYVHAPELEEFTYSLDEDGEKVVTFEIGYTGVTTTVGKHTVTAYIKSATLTVDGEEYDVTDCFKLDAEKEYVVNAQTVTVEWVGKADVEEGENEFAWAYDGNPHAPEAYITTEGGERIKLDVYGAEINARDKAYTATAVLPAGYALANGSSTATQEYFINKATIEVIWEFGDVEADENGVYSWTYGDNVEIKAYIKVTTVDEDGSVTVTKGAELTVMGIETDAGTHTATVMQNDGNYAFKTADEATREYVIKPLEVYVVWYGADGTANDASKNFEWTFTGKAIAPKAYLADEDGNLIKDKDNNPIPVEVSGGVAEVGEHTAQAVDTFVNYVFAEEFTKTYKVLAKDLADNDFKWTADGATKVDGLTFTYEYSGDNIMPVPSADVEDIEFNVTIKNADGPVLAITEVGTYTITVTSRDENYSVPEDMKTVTVIVTARNVKVEWDKTQLVYNGEKQIPKAYFEDVAGNLIELEVTVDGDSRKAGVEYTATADLSSTNYELDADTKTYTFEIAQKEINVEFVWEDVTYDGKEHAPTPIVVLGAAEKEGITVVYKITKNGADAAGDGEKVKNAGEYVMTVSLDGENKGNYKLVNAECKFTINKVALTVTADDKKVTYGGDKPTYTATIKGFISEEEETKLTEALNERINQWLRCSYINTTVPGEYAIEIATRWLNDFLENYEVTPKNGTLTVEPAANKLVWQGENANNLEFVYNGKSNLPKAYYYDQSGRKISLNVKLAELQDGEYVVKEGTAVNVGTYYAVIVDEDGNVVKGDGSYTFENYGTSFEITQLEITVNIKDMPFTYGDIDKDNLEEILGEGSGWYYADSYTIPDDLGIKLTITGKYDKGNYLENGVYAITPTWDETAHGNNYKVEFVDEGSRELIVNLAKVTVKDYDFVIGEDGMLNVYDNYGILDGNGYESDFIKDVYDNNPKKFLTIAGYQDAEIEQYFRLLEGDELPNPGTGLYTDERPESLFEEGTYVFNFKVLIPNHQDFVGRLYVKVDYASNYLFVKVDGKGTYTSEYGYEVTENLAKELLEKGYAEYDTNISRVDEETFLDWVTATVVDEKGNEVTGKLPVGSYKVFFGLNEKADEKYSIYKATTRFVNLEVTKYEIDIDWGNDDNLKYEYDGNVHMPVIKVEGTVLDDSCKVSDGVYAITVNGEVVKVTVTVDGDFTSEGGHSVLVTIDGENFSISEDDSLRSVSIIEPTKTVEVEVPGNGEAKKGLETWQLGLIIGAALLLLLLVIILLIALTKRKPVVMNDSDGFYDDVSESDLQG